MERFLKADNGGTADAADVAALLAEVAAAEAEDDAEEAEVAAALADVLADEAEDAAALADAAAAVTAVAIMEPNVMLLVPIVIEPVDVTTNSTPV